MPSASPKMSLSPKKSYKKVYKWILIGLLVVLGILLIVSIMRKKREGFESGAGKLMYFYMPGCGHCNEFNPQWEKMQSKIDQDRLALTLTKIDGTDDANKDLVNQYKVNGFPTIILEIGSNSSTYDGERTADALYAWCKDKLGVSATSAPVEKFGYQTWYHNTHRNSRGN
jgi:thiol-disulfide isomerase/thioredoxin